jgi:hypothetical protein
MAEYSTMISESKVGNCEKRGSRWKDMWIEENRDSISFQCVRGDVVRVP